MTGYLVQYRGKAHLVCTVDESADVAGLCEWTWRFHLVAEFFHEMTPTTWVSRKKLSELAVLWEGALR